MKRNLLTVGLIAAVFAQSCRKPAAPTPTSPSVPKVSYNYEDFDGVKVITGLEFKVRDKWVRYKPIESDGDKYPGFYFKPVISPDGQWVLLPYSRLKGFRYCRAVELEDCIEGKKNWKRVYFTTKQGREVYGTFVEWLGDGHMALIELDQEITTERCKFSFEDGGAVSGNFQLNIE